MTTKKPWEVEGVSFNTESKFWQFVRGVLRKGWSRHQVKLQFIKKYRVKVPNPNPDARVETVWGMTCCKCNNDFPLPVNKKLKKKIETHNRQPFNYIEINHKTEAGSLKCKEDVGRFAANLLFVTFDDLEPMCKECHGILTHQQRTGLGESEAILEKQTIEIIKSKKDKQWLIERGVTPASNSSKRRQQIREVLTQEVLQNGN